MTTHDTATGLNQNADTSISKVILPVYSKPLSDLKLSDISSTYSQDYFLTQIESFIDTNRFSALNALIQQAAQEAPPITPESFISSSLGSPVVSTEDAIEASKDFYVQSALTYSIKTHHKAACEFMLDQYGPSARSEAISKLLPFAIDSGHTNMVEFLLEKSMSNTPIKDRLAQRSAAQAAQNIALDASAPSTASAPKKTI